jgi:sugar fermentation stimulation protein A
MRFEAPAFEGKILKRYKRFFADVELADGQLITAHLANTGSMKACYEPGWRALVTYHDSPTRKLKYSLEMTGNDDTWIGVNTAIPNKLFKEALELKSLEPFADYDQIQPEYKIGDSRLDFFLQDSSSKFADCYIEIKNVTLKGDNKVALFPDAKSERGQKHLQELIKLKIVGHRCAMVYIVQREDVTSFAPAIEIDPIYSKLLKEAVSAGVEIYPYQCKLSPQGISIKKLLPYSLD